ncbi:Transposase [Sulfidibacter corallicola]|uniref:Transposase n=1 Tax=Sulfidibacter corallicola TaxID=2818388 RepID=A0A8A4THJ7_SULCO|nr:transposase [Sulfidibacter corallicola]QTD49020.1 transposase [Sulfidibacter corallicola]
MSRRPRIKPQQPVTRYHVMTRTAQQAFYLSDQWVPGFKDRCLQIIEAMADIYYVDLFAWVLMDNHYHLCIEVRRPDICAMDIQARYERLQEHKTSPRPWRTEYVDRYYRRFTDLSRFMAEINLRMTRAFNKACGTSGHMWGGRFKSKIIENDESMLRVMTYIEQNPVRAGICQRPSEYEWCSAGNCHQRLAMGRSTTVPAVGFVGTWPKEKRALNIVDPVV